MSSITTSLINTANGTTSLGLQTGNTSGPSIAINTSNQITLKANSTVNAAFANTTNVQTNLPLTVNGAINVTNTATGVVAQFGTDNQNRSINLSENRAKFGIDANDAYVKGGVGKGASLYVNDTEQALDIDTNGDATFSNNVTVTNNITAANLTVSSNTLTLGSSSIAANGYTTLPNGLQLKWGYATISSSTTTVTFPTPFASVLYSINLTNTEDGKIWVTSSNTSTFTADNQAASSIVYYMAIGV